MVAISRDGAQRGGAIKCVKIGALEREHGRVASMSRTMRRAVAGSLLALLLSACATSSQVLVQPAARTQVENYHSVYLVTHGGDSSDMDVNVERALLKRGFSVTTGTDAAQPPNAQLVVKYVDDWKWDMAMYLRSFDLMMFDGRSKVLLADGTWRNSLLHGFYSAPKVVDQVVGRTVKKLESK